MDEWGSDEVGSWPEIWGQESVGLLQSGENGSNEILSGSGLTLGICVDIIDTSELQDFLGDLGSNATSSSWGWHESDGGGTALTVDLGWDGMDTTDLGSPISSSDWDDVALSIIKGSLNSNLHFLGDLDSNTNVSLSVSASNDSLESGSLSSLGLLLDGKNGHDLIRELMLDVGEKSINDWCFLDWDGVGVDFFERIELSSFNESSELGKWGPFVLVETSWSSSSSSGSTSTSSSSSISTSISSTESSSGSSISSSSTSLF